jgi:uncharacterized iron-regulated protein
MARRPTLTPRVALPLVLAAACATSHAERPIELAWQSALHREHPLVGRIWDVRAGRFASEPELVRALSQASFVLLGETHDNPDHHLLQARLLEAIVGTGRRPALAFEMLDVDQQGEVDAVLRGPAPTAGTLRDAVDWDRSGWPAFAMYQPIFQVGLAAHLPIVAANLSRPSARAVIHLGTGALTPVVQQLLAHAGPLPADEERERREEMEALHCGQLPEQFLGPMVLSQRARDAQLAAALHTGATAGGAVLVTGAEHARRDRGVGAFLRVAGVPPERIASVAFREVNPEAREPAEYEGGPYDYVVFTPATEREDPCREMRPPATPAPRATPPGPTARR